MTLRRIRYQGTIALVRELVKCLYDEGFGYKQVHWTPTFMRRDAELDVTVGTNFVVTVEGDEHAIDAALQTFWERFDSDARDALDGPFQGEPAPA